MFYLSPLYFDIAHKSRTGFMCDLGTGTKAEKNVTNVGNGRRRDVLWKSVCAHACALCIHASLPFCVFLEMCVVVWSVLPCVCRLLWPSEKCLLQHSVLERQGWLNSGSCGSNDESSSNCNIIPSSKHFSTSDSEVVSFHISWALSYKSQYAQRQ